MIALYALIIDKSAAPLYHGNLKNDDKREFYQSWESDISAVTPPKKKKKGLIAQAF